MLFDLLLTFFAETPATEPDAGDTGGAATPPDDKGTPAQSGATSSDVVQLSKKEYADLLSAKGLLSSIHSQRDKERQQYEQNIQLLQAEVDRGQQEAPTQKSALDQILAGTGSTGDDLFVDDVAGANVGFIKQVTQALQADVDTKLSAYDTEIQNLKGQLAESENKNILASRTLQRRLSIDAAMNDKIAKLQSEYRITRQEAADFISAREKAIDALQQLPQVDDAEIGGLYSLVDDIIDGVADRKNKLALHKTEIEQTETDEKAQMKTLLEGDRKPDRTKIVLDLNKEKVVEEHGLTPIAKGETREEYAYRQIQEQLDKTLAKEKQALVSAGFK